MASYMESFPGGVRQHNRILQLYFPPHNRDMQQSDPRLGRRKGVHVRRRSSAPWADARPLGFVGVARAKSLTRIEDLYLTNTAKN